jgi:RNA polymerase sigma-70 factor (ECF subfamily)
VKRVLEEAIAELPAEQRAVLVLRVFEEMSYDEIAASLELRPGTVMSRLYRARERLARALGPYLRAPGRRKEGLR